MPRFLHVGFNFAGQPKVKELEAAFSATGDWLRYSQNCWLIWTERTASDTFNALKPYLANDDQFLILEVNMNERNGWLPEWLWNWMNARQQYQSNAVSGLSGLSVFGGAQSPLGVASPNPYEIPINPFWPPKK